MEVASRTAVRLDVVWREPVSRLMTVPAALGFILLGPVILPEVMPRIAGVPGSVRMVLLIAFLVVIAGAAVLSTYAERYVVDKTLQTFTIEQTGFLGNAKRVIPLRQLRVVEQVGDDGADTLREHVVLVLSPANERLKLPVRLYSFSAKERDRFAGILGSFLGIPIRLVRR